MIDPKKTYKTRDGREVRILMTDGVSMPFLTKEVANNYTPMAGRIRRGTICTPPLRVLPGVSR